MSKEEAVITEDDLRAKWDWGTVHANTTPDRRLALFVEKEFDEVWAKQIKIRGSDAHAALWDLATMPINDNSYMMAVKRQACIDLIKMMRPEDQTLSGNEGENLLAQLRKDYHDNAPRIREIRERTVVFERGEESASSGLVIDGSTG